MRWNVSVATLAASWGFIAILVSAVDLDATVLVFYRLALAAITIGAIAVASRRRTLIRPGPSWKGLAAVGLVLAAHWSLYFLTIKLSSVAVAVVTVYTAPLFIAAVAPFFLPESWSPVALAALVPACAGIVLIAVAGNDGGHVRPAAIASGLGAGALYAVLVIYGKRLRLQLNPVTFAFWAYLIAAVASAPLLAASAQVAPNSWREVGALLLLGVVFTGISGVLYVTLLGHVTAQAIGVLAFVEPVSAALLAWAILGQSLGAAVLIGGALVLLAGTVVVIREPADAAAVEVPALDGRTTVARRADGG
jgi:drug/metabolite transporter (DMT)-like permease